MNSVPEKIKKNIEPADMLFAALFCASVLYSLFLAPYGWAGSDEAFYIAEPYRFVQGDVFFVDDWNCGQLFAFLTVPLMKLHLALASSGDGLILAFRYYYVAVAAAVSLFIYLKSRRVSKWGALFASMFLLLYSPLSVRSLSYNAMGLMSLALACVLAFTAEKKPFVSMYFAGIFLAATVLCCPFAVAIYVFYALFVSGLFFLSKRFEKIREGFSGFAFGPKALAAVTLGAGTLFVVFCAFVFSRASLAEVIKSFPMLFADPEHKPAAISWLIKNIVYCTITSSPIALECVLACGALGLALCLDRRRMAHRKLYLVLFALVSVIYCLPYVNSNICNELMLPINILGFAAYVLSEHRQKKIFRLMFVPGLMYAVCMHHSSSLRYIALCNGFALCSLASAFFICNAAGELWQEHKNKASCAALLTALVMLCLLPAQLGLELHSRASNFFHDDSFAMLDTKIEQSVQKGLISSAEHVQAYNALVGDTEHIRSAEGEYVLYVGDTVWLPMGDHKLSANNSLWTNYDKPEASARMLRKYLEYFPEKRPEYIYVTKTLTYTYQDDIDGMVIVDIINIENRPVTETETGYVIKMN